MLTIGIIDILRIFFDTLLIIIGFPVFLYYFFSNPRGFIQRFGIDPEVIDRWPTNNASESHLTKCVICYEEILLGQAIMILKCNELHFYHAPCIKNWLKFNLSCPHCRSQDIL